jgi:hypothetical protein
MRTSPNSSLLALSLTLATSLPGAALAAGPTGLPDALNVKVTNTPLPVTGVVSGQVTVTGQPNVTVVNTAANPVPTRVVSSQQPWSHFASCDSTGSNSCLIETAVIPAGKRLVLQYVNGSLQFPGTTVPQAFNVFLGSGPYLGMLPRLVSSSSGLNNYAVNETVLGFVAAGQKITINALGFGFGINASAYLSGYLVDAN